MPNSHQASETYLQQQTTDARLGILETRVGGLERNLHTLDTTVASGFKLLNEKLDERSRTPWATLAAFFGVTVTVVVGLWGIALRPLDASVTRLDATLADTRNNMVTNAANERQIKIATDALLKLDGGLDRVRDNTVPRAEYTEKWSNYETQRQDTRTRYDDRFKRIEAMQDDLQKQIVPRGEHEQRWAGNARDIEGLQRQINDQKKAFGETFSLRDALQQMQRRIDFLEGRTRPPA